MKLFQKLFPDADKLKEQEQKIEGLEIESEDLRKKNLNLWERYNKEHSNYVNALNEISQLKSRIREQTDADILLVSARIIMATLNGKKPESTDVVLQRNLLAQQQAMGYAGLNQYGMNSMQNIFSSIGGALWQ